VLPTVAGLLEQVCVAGGLPDFVRLLISRRVNWMGRVISMVERRNVYRVLVDKERNCLAGIGMNWSVLDWMLMGGCELDSSGLG